MTGVLGCLDCVEYFVSEQPSFRGGTARWGQALERVQDHLSALWKEDGVGKNWLGGHSLRFVCI